MLKLNLSMPAIIGGIVFGLAGVFVFYRGKNERRFWSMIIGLALMAYPVLIPNDLAVWVIGICLLAVAWIVR